MSMCCWVISFFVIFAVLDVSLAVNLCITAVFLHLYLHNLFTYGSPIILVLSASNIVTKFRRGHPCGGDEYRCGVKISRFSTNKSLYLANETRYRYSYYGTLIETRMRSIRWCQFWWPWTNPNPVFKVTPLFDAKYLTNCYRYGHSYYRSRIWNRTQAFEWHQFQWPWVTSNPDFKVTIILYHIT